VSLPDAEKVMRKRQFPNMIDRLVFYGAYMVFFAGTLVVAWIAPLEYYDVAMAFCAFTGVIVVVSILVVQSRSARSRNSEESGSSASVDRETDAP
jgi:hypothetical protein